MRDERAEPQVLQEVWSTVSMRTDRMDLLDLMPGMSKRRLCGGSAVSRCGRENRRCGERYVEYTAVVVASTAQEAPHHTRTVESQRSVARKATK